MPSLLAVLASPRGDYSVSTQLVHAFVDTWKQEHGGGNVVTRELYKTTLPFVDVPWMLGAYTPAEQHSPEIKQAIAISDELIAELKAADHIVIGAPMYNFSVPAILKAYIDHIVRINVTFTPQYEGLLKGKKVTVIQASGGVYSAGSHMETYNSETPYLKAILAFIGITDVTFVMAGDTSSLNTGKATLEELVARYTPEVQASAY